MMILRAVRRMLGMGPSGFTLVRKDGSRHNRIRGDLIPARSLVIVEDGRVFVRADEADEAGFEVYREGHRTHLYFGWD